MEMRNFYDVLAREEALRDPLVIHIHPPDEDTPEGLQNRKTAVNLGIHFRGGKNLGGMSIGGVEIETNTGVRIMCHEEGTKLNSTVGSTNSTDFLMDMPFPASEDGESTDDLITPLSLTGTISLLTNRSEHYSIISNDYR